MREMKVKIKHLHANPFRDLENYPFNRDKIDQLKRSIEQTGFWDNIVARSRYGEIQIAYGHHRLKALQELFDGNYEVEIPIKDLDDELMLKIMANENMEEWKSSPAVIDETVRAVIRFLEPGLRDIDQESICKFLGWPDGRVKHSLVRINAIKDGDIDKEAIESIPTAKAQTAFVAKARGLKPSQQRQVAKRITESGDLSVRGVQDKVLAVKEKRPSKVLTLESKIRDLIGRIKSLDKALVEMEQLSKEIGEETLVNNSTAMELQAYLRNISIQIKQLIK